MLDCFFVLRPPAHMQTLATATSLFCLFGYSFFILFSIVFESFWGWILEPFWSQNRVKVRLMLELCVCAFPCVLVVFEVFIRLVFLH